MVVRKIIKAIPVQIIIALLLITAMCPAGVFAATENGDLEVDGIEYSFSFDTASHKATIKAVKNPASETNVSLPSTVTYKGESYSVETLKIGSFSGEACPNIKNLTIPDSIKSIEGSLKSFNAVKSISIPGSVKTFKAQFQHCNELETITFEEGVEEIYSNSMIYGLSKLTTVKLPSTLKAIDSYAFADAPALKAIDLPKNVDTGGSFTLKGCKSLETVDLPDTVTKISASAFNGCSSLQKVTAKGPIVDVGAYAFDSCTKLKEIPDLSKVNRMGTSAFEGCAQLKADIDLSSLEAIPGYAFYNVPLKSVKFSDNLKSIGNWAFFKSQINELKLPESVESIGACAFHSVPISGTVELPDSVTSVGKRAFAYTDISEIKVGRGLTDISQESFSNPDGTTAPDTLKKIIFNNSKDNIRNASYLPKDVEIIYLMESIGDVGDTISDEPGAKTLQEAVNESKPGDTIVIKKHVKLPKTLNIPKGKDITIKSEGFTILANEEKKLGDLINVEEGAALTLEDLTISGRYNSKTLICNEGKVTINDGAVLCDSSVEKYSGVIKTTGENASLVMNGGEIKNNRINDQDSGVINVSNKAGFLMTGGKISDNKVTDSNAFNSSAGVFLTTGAKAKMTGGEISGNKAIRGAAVMLYNVDKTGEENRTFFEMTGGKLSDNECKSGTLGGGGALHIEGNSEAIMTGGKISGNKGVMGAGVCAVDYGLQVNGEEERNATFVLDGGEISSNEGWTGAGIYSYTNGVKLLSGKIINNTAGNHGGGVYSEGNESVYSNTFIDNALVTNNTAEQGGGLWFCPTGTANIRPEDEMVVFDNKATGAGDDFVSASKKDGYDVTLPDRLKSGDRIYWYEDGAVHAPAIANLSIVPSVDKNAPRYGEAGALASPVKVENSDHNLALKAVTDPYAKELAAERCTLLISGNKAAHGGGVAANGGVNDNHENDEKQELVVRKLWEDGGSPQGMQKAKPESVKFTLVIEGRALDSVVLNEDNNWTQSFHDISSDIPIEKIAVKEEDVPGFAVSYEKVRDNEGNITITASNVYSPGTGGLELSKIVKGTNRDKEKEFTFSVTLSDKSINGVYGNMEFKNGVSTVILRHGERITASGLPERTTYTVEEIDYKGYSVKVNGNKAGEIEADKTAEVEFVNSSTFPDKPETGDESRLLAAVIMMIIATAGAVGITLVRRRRQI